MAKKIVLLLLLLCLPAFANAGRYTEVSCSQYGSHANSCDQCFDGGAKYVGDTFTPDDYFRAGSKAQIYWQDENWTRYTVTSLNSNTSWYASNDLIGYPPNFLWYTAQHGSNVGRKYHFFPANSNERIYATKTGKGIKLQNVSGDNVSPHLPAMKFTFVINHHDYLGGSNQGAKKEHRECVFYKPRYCGDGILQVNKGETCDPGDATKRGWGNGGCNTNTCQPINNPVCKSLTVNKTTGEAPTSVEATCSGYKVNTFKIDCGNGQVFTGNGNNSGNQTFKRTCNYTSAGSFTPTCYINNTITSNSCKKTVNITKVDPSIIVDKRDANVFDLDGNVGNDTQTVYKGDEAKFRIRVTNNGQETLKNIKLIDTVEASCATRSGTFVNLTGKKFTNQNNNNVNISVGGSGNHANSTLEVGEWFEYTCKKPNTQSNYTNTVKTIGTGITSGTNVNDSDPTVVKVVTKPVPEISVDKRDANTNDIDGNIGGNDSQTVGVTDSAVFRITVTNTGEEDLKNIKLTDARSLSCASETTVNLTGKKFLNVNGDNVTISVSGAGNHSDNILQVGEKFTYTCSKENTQESYTNTVNVSGVGVISGNTDTDTDPTEVILSTDPNIQIIKEDANSNDIDHIQFNDTQTVLLGDEAIFHITIKNTGNEDLKDITLTDAQALACGTKGNTKVNLANRYFTNASDVQVIINYLISSPGDHADDILQVGEEFSYTCSAPNAQSNYTNIVKVGGVGVITGAIVGDEDPSVVIVRDGIYDLALRKTLSNTTPGPFSSGSTVIFDITVYNQGNIDSGIVEVTDYIPTGLTFVGGNGWTQSGSIITQSIINIVVGGNTALTVSFTVDANAPSSITNYAEISSDSGDDCDSTPDNDNTNDGIVIDDDIGNGCNPGGDEDDHDPETIVIGNPIPSIKIEKLDANPNLDQDSVDGNDTQTVNQGEKAVFSIRVTNDGPVSLDTLILTDAIAPNCAGSVTLPGTYPSTWSNFITGGTGNKTDTVLESGEWFEYTCEKSNTQSNYTNTAGVTAQAVGTNTVVSDSDASLVIKKGGSPSSSSGGSTLKCLSATQSGSVVTCKGNSKAKSFYLKCGSTIKGPVNTLISSGQHYAEFDCSASVYQCYVDNTRVPSSGSTSAWFDSQAWRTSTACLQQGSSSGGGSGCGNGILETNRGEQCDFGSGKNGVGTNACSSTCKIKTVSSNCESTNTCVLTWPNGGDMIFGLSAQSIIGHLGNPLEGMGSISLTNNSDYDMLYDNFCVKRTNSDQKGGIYALSSGNASGEYCADIAGDVIYAYETITLGDYSVSPDYTGNKNGISGSSYGDTTLTASVKVNGIDYYNAYFSKKADIRVAKPAVVTTGGGTSYVKSSTTADVAQVTSGKSGYDNNKNFAGTSVSNIGISSYAQEVTNTGAIESVVDEKDVYEKAVESVTQTTASTTQTVTSFSEKYNGLNNIYIVKGKNVQISSIPTGITESTTFIVEGGDLIITGDIITNENVAFVVKGGDIIIKSNVVQLDGTYISIPAGGNGGNIISEASADQLIINGSLYGNIDNLVANRYYISQDAGGQLSVGTIVSFGSSLFSRPAPLVSQFVGEYLASEKVAK